MDAEGQAVAGPGDGIDDPAEIVAPDAQDVEDGAEDLAGQVVETVDGDQGRGNEMAGRAGGRQRDPMHGVAALPHPRHMFFDRLPRSLADDRPDIGGEPVGIADRQFGHGAFEHGEDAVGDFLLEAEHTERRAALSGGIEGRHHHIGDDLLRQGGGIDDHGVLATGFGHERDRPSIRPEPPGEFGLDRLGDIGRAGEEHAVDPRIGHEASADRTVSRQETEHAVRNSRLDQDLHGEPGHQGRFLGRLCKDGIAGGERRRDLTDEDGEGEVPRADTGDDAKGRMSRGIESRCLRCVIAQEIHRLADLADGIGEGLAGFSDQQPEERVASRLDPVGRCVQDFSPPRWRRRRPGAGG